MRTLVSDLLNFQVYRQSQQALFVKLEIVLRFGMNHELCSYLVSVLTVGIYNDQLLGGCRISNRIPHSTFHKRAQDYPALGPKIQ